MHRCAIIAQSLADVRRQQIDLVQHPDLPLAGGFKFFQHPFHLGLLAARMRLGHIGDMQQQRRPLHLFQRRPKRRYQGVRQVADKPHCIRQQHFALRGQSHRPDRRVKGGKQLGGFQHSRLGQSVKQGGLAGIGISHQGNRGHGDGLAPLPLLRPRAPHVFQLLLHRANPPMDLAPVGLKLGFTRPSRADSAAQL